VSRELAAAGFALVSAVLAAAGCQRPAGSHGLEYMPDMARPVPYEAFSSNPVTRNGLTLQAPVAGTVARGARPLHYGPEPEEAERAGRELTDPFPPTPEVLARGRHVYVTFCAVCHGAAGAGDGPIVPKFPHPPSYQSARLRAMPEGQVFHVVTFGTALMPGYAAQIQPDDRWKVVRYVQHLQRGGAQ
jgi:mono/diheme cytochrome c family protein